MPEPLRIRMKVWTHPITGKRFLCPLGMMKSISDKTMLVYIMSEEHTEPISITADEWDALPFFYFKEDGEAPRPTKRVPDAVRL